MQQIEPEVFLVGETREVPQGVEDFLNHVGAPDWKTDAPSDGEKIIELMGRLCYRSFKPGLNPNVTKVRDSNKDYIENIVRVKHGSVTEHAQVNFIFANVSRVFTHELVRHRVGVGISQESLRFVRLDKLGAWVPTAIKENKDALEIFVETFEQLEELQKDLTEIYELDKEGTKFHKKKQITSAMRRIAPIGLATNIGWSANFRALRWVLEMRTDPAAEEEIRVVFGQVGKIVCERYPNMFGDFVIEEEDGLPWYRPESSKV